MQRTWRFLLATALLAGGSVLSPSADRVAAVRPADVAEPGMAVTPVLSNLPYTPVAFRFAPDGRIYIALKQGRVLMYDGPGDTSPVTTLDITREVNSYLDRGLLGLALDPAFATGRPYLYVLYSYDRDPFGADASVPRWNDVCPNPPGANTDGCTISARLDRYTVGADGVAVGPPVRLLDGADGPTGGWCNQYPTHSIGTIDFGPDGTLYVGSGDGASFTFADYGQGGGSVNSPTPPNPCNDTQATIPRTGGRGTPLRAADSRGGALRSQAVRGALNGEYISWDGAILRIDPDTGAAAAGNPLIANDIGGDDRIVAYGLRNPFRFTLRPGTSEVWLGDVGWNTYEEIDSFVSGPGQSAVPNFGWPCYEGPARMGSYDSLDAGLCESLYATNTSSLGGVASPLVAPKYSWTRYGNVGALGCATTASGGAATGGGFATNVEWPAEVRGAYVFGDYSRRCLVAMPLGANGQPDPSRVRPLVSDTAPVDIRVGPAGDIYWIDIATLRLNRLRPLAGNLAPVASFNATPSAGPLPLTVQFDARATTDPNPGEALTYNWDLDADGLCDDGSGVTISRTYTVAATLDVTLCVSDQILSATTSRQIQPGNAPPVIQTLTTSADTNGWKVGDTVTFSASATDDSGTLGPDAFEWRQTIKHCESRTSAQCHPHDLGLASGPGGSLAMPDHEYYASVLLTLTVTDRFGASTTREVDLRPRISNVTIRTNPPGITVSAGASTGASPLTVAFLEGGSSQLTVPEYAVVGGVERRFVGWSDSSASRLRTVNAPAGDTTYTAVYTPQDEPVAPVGPVPPTPAAPLAPVPAVASAPPGAADGTGRVRGVTPVRLLDTRDGTGGTNGQVAAGDTVRVQVTGANGVSESTTAVVVNLTAVGAASPAHVTAFPCGVLPVVSNLNVSTPDAVANLATVPLDGLGGLCLNVSAPTDVIVDLTAVVDPGSGDRYSAITPRRVLDTRDGTGPSYRRLPAGEVVRIPLGLASPPVDASAVLANFTVTAPESAGFVTVFSCAAALPLASNLNYVEGQTVSNLVLSALDGSGELCVMSMVATDLVVDVSGWWGPSSDSMSLVDPRRVLDTRASTAAPASAPPIARLPGGTSVVLDAGELGAPFGATSMIANVTAVDPTTAGFVTVYPCDKGLPLASNVNHGENDTRPVLTVTAFGADGRICLYTLAETDLIVDLQGWMIAR